MTWIDNLRRRVKALKSDTMALYFAARHPQTPWHAKLLVAVVVAYALSPIDLIPDFIPVLGYLDDLIVLPLGIALAIRMIPASVMDECRTRAQKAPAQKPESRLAAVVIVLTWLVLASAFILCIRRVLAVA